MKPLKDFLQATYEKAAIDQIAEDYASKGYSIRKQYIAGPYKVDVAAFKDNETIYIEVKSRKESSTSKRRIKEMTEYFKTIPNVKFVVAISRYPEPKKIEFDELEGVLYNYFMVEFPSELDALSTHTRMDSVHDVSINSIEVGGGELKLSCNGSVSVSLQYGSDSEQEDDEPFIMSFPFEFEGTLKYEGNDYSVIDCETLEVDTDAFYQ